jgi:hypothetical protein
MMALSSAQNYFCGHCRYRIQFKAAICGLWALAKLWRGVGKAVHCERESERRLRVVSMRLGFPVNARYYLRSVEVLMWELGGTVS